MRDLLTEIEKLKNEIPLKSAPIYYSNSEASAWLDGYLTAVEEIIAIVKRKEV